MRINVAQLPERWEHLKPVQQLIGQRDFDGAIQSYEAMLLQPGAARAGDLILFDLALLHSHYANPRKDYRRSLAFFSRLLREYPRSPLGEEAKIWSDLLETMERTKRVDIELDEKKKAFDR
ncbi:MAG: hypothetical protein A2010_11635 [Nitrospirae bacterium GWD2_57_9]|nr:MAG: hypothetical protein A2010_11635 [Nitrospirae bacterium GWD2_57_9]